MPAFPFVPGFEVSGIIEKVGPGVSSSLLGKEVIALTGEQMGGHANFVNVPEGNLIAKPANISHEEACSLPVVFGTANYALKAAELKSGESILIQTAAGGCGLLATQLANLVGAIPVGTSSKARKLKFLQDIGVEYQGNYSSPDFEAAMSEMTQGAGFDVVLNMLSGEMIQTGLNLLGPGGRYIELAVHALKTSANLDLSKLVENQQIKSIDLRRMLLSADKKKRLEAWSSFNKMVELVEQGKIHPVVSRIYPLDQIGEAMAYVESGQHLGKVVISHTATEMVDHEANLREKLSNQKKQAQLNPVSLYESQSKPMTVLQEPSGKERVDIAIVGMAARMPSSKTKEEFWENLKQGFNGVKEVPESRWKLEEYFNPNRKQKGKSYSKWLGILDDIDKFDPLFFNISPMEAELMDPQQRLWLEESWKAIEDAGYTASELAKYNCGVFIGVDSGDYASLIKDRSVLNAQVLMGNNSSILSARVSYLLNLTGPALAIDTACSSSLVAIAQACDCIVAGTSDMVLAGGVSVFSTPKMHIMTSKAGMLSENGRCHTFDQQAKRFCAVGRGRRYRSKKTGFSRERQ